MSRREPGFRGVDFGIREPAHRAMHARREQPHRMAGPGDIGHHSQLTEVAGLREAESGILP